MNNPIIPKTENLPTPNYPPVKHIQYRGVIKEIIANMTPHWDFEKGCFRDPEFQAGYEKWLADRGAEKCGAREAIDP